MHEIKPFKIHIHILLISSEGKYIGTLKLHNLLAKTRNTLYLLQGRDIHSKNLGISLKDAGKSTGVD